MDFFAVSFVIDIERYVEMRSFCLLTTKKLIVIQTCSIVFVNSLKKILLKKVIAINIMVIKPTQIKSECNKLKLGQQPAMQPTLLQLRLVHTSLLCSQHYFRRLVHTTLKQMYSVTHPVLFFLNSNGCALVVSPLAFQ